jgi:hypothetical protein
MAGGAPTHSLRISFPARAAELAYAARELGLLIIAQSVVALTPIELIPLDPAAQRLPRDPEAAGNIADRAAGSDQPNGVTTKLLQIRRPGLRHDGTFLLPRLTAQAFRYPPKAGHSSQACRTTWWVVRVVAGLGGSDDP